MTIEQLIELLNECQDEFGPETEVRLMTQPTWPFENSIKGITSSVEIHDDGVDRNGVVYIVEGDQIAYGSKSAWDVCRES